MKILHVIGSLAPRHGGPSKACVEMAAEVSRRGHQVEIFTTDQDGPDRLSVPTDRPMAVRGVEVHYFRSNLRGIWPLSIPLWRALAEKVADFDLVHIHSVYLFHGAVAGYYCRKFGVPYVMRPHGTLDPFLYERHRLRKRVYESLIERRNLRSAAAIHFTAREELQLAQPYCAGAPGIVVPLGIHLHEYASLPAAGTFRAAFPEIGNRRIVLYLGRLNFKKGLDILIEAFAQVAQQIVSTHLVIAGPDNEGLGPELRRLVARLDLTARVTFAGMLEGTPKLAAFRDASVFALPSYSENFGIAVAEAMACRVPVVISDKVNIWREVEAAAAGLVVRCDAQSTASALIAVLDDELGANDMGARGQTLVRERFSWPTVAEKLEAMYRDVLSGRIAHATEVNSLPADR